MNRSGRLRGGVALAMSYGGGPRSLLEQVVARVDCLELAPDVMTVADGDGRGRRLDTWPAAWSVDWDRDPAEVVASLVEGRPVDDCPPGSFRTRVSATLPRLFEVDAV